MDELTKVLNMRDCHVLKMKHDCERILKYSKYSMESRIAYCYYLLKDERVTIEILEQLSNKTSHDYFILGQAYYNIHKYKTALHQFKQIKSGDEEYENALSFIVRIYSMISDPSKLLKYLSDTIPNFHINMELIRGTTLLLLYTEQYKFGVNAKELNQFVYLLNQGADPCVMGKYKECALSQAIYNNDDDLLKLFLSHMGYHIIDNEYNITSFACVEKITDIRYYVYKVFTNEKDELIAKYGSEFFDTCYNYLDIETFSTYGISDEFCKILVDYKDILNSSLVKHGIQIKNI